MGTRTTRTTWTPKFGTSWLLQHAMVFSCTPRFSASNGTTESSKTELSNQQAPGCRDFPAPCAGKGRNAHWHRVPDPSHCTLVHIVLKSIETCACFPTQGPQIHWFPSQIRWLPKSRIQILVDSSGNSRMVFEIFQIFPLPYVLLHPSSYCKFRQDMAEGLRSSNQQLQVPWITVNHGWWSQQTEIIAVVGK